jgi:TonB-dependent SusC/RagA subfamily outer membrane receptor
MTIEGGRARGGALAGALLLVAAGCASSSSYQTERLTPERVHIGYGTAEPRDVTASIGSVNREELEEGRSMRLVDLLESRVPGVRVIRRPDGDLSLRIRGASNSMSGEPLIVVNGTPILSNRLVSVLGTLNPLELARVDVLKDAGSTAMYGVRGGNGVILITTRRGK